MNNQLGDPSGGKRHALIVRQISPFLTSLVPLDGCPMFADFRVHGLNKIGDPGFLPRGTQQRPRVRLSVRKAA